MRREYYEAYDDRYRQVHGQNLAWFSDTPSPIVSEVIQEHGICGKILEIGCGEGRDAAVLLERGYDLLATDVSKEAISFCRRKWPRFSGAFQVLDCINDTLEQRFDFIYAVAVLHMLVHDEDRFAFYRFISSHLCDDGIALICTMGDGEAERSSDPATAFMLQERVHEETGKVVRIAETSYRAVSFPTFHEELQKNGFEILHSGITRVEPDYGTMMYATVKKG